MIGAGLPAGRRARALRGAGDSQAMAPEEIDHDRCRIDVMGGVADHEAPERAARLLAARPGMPATLDLVQNQPAATEIVYPDMGAVVDPVGKVARLGSPAAVDPRPEADRIGGRQHSAADPAEPAMPDLAAGPRHQ